MNKAIHLHNEDLPPWDDVAPGVGGFLAAGGVAGPTGDEA